MNDTVYDLRSALALLHAKPGELVVTDTEVDPHAELSGVYRYVGAGGTTMRPTRIGPAMLFNRIKGFPDFRVVTGVLAARRRVGLLLGCDPTRLGHLLKDAVQHPVPPVMCNGDEFLCQQQVHLASDPAFDLRTLLPAPTNTEEDAGPFFTMGLCYASDPHTGESDITIHRLCVQGRDELSMYFAPGRHLDVFRQKAEAAGQALPLTISIGVDPAIYIGACFEPPTTPQGFDELSVAGALRGRPVELAQALTVNARAIAHAEVVIEGELLPDRRVQEDRHTQTGRAMPEFPGYIGIANPALPVIKVKAVTHRRNPILQHTIGCSEEHVSMAGIPTEASILALVERAMPGKLLNVYAHSAGGGKLLAVLQFKKSGPQDEGRQRQAALLAFAAFPELKQAIVVDEDVDIFDSNDVLWAMQTRYQGDVDTLFIPGVRCHPLDPSQSPDYNPALRGSGISCKTIFDCTVPWALKAKFRRCQFREVEVKRFLPDFR
ncbi:UbiD family decarboxylase [Erwinia sp. E602]|uniref:UbiD family decarboxylase n=1 Tax=Erwinia sp. E602 TaxID=2675378 RepID=UPI001BAB680C|nr:UbiD family decarboxylase [Erwinia sp. E602]QUG73853.1 UbiD family decarboxylase [Erwinia sp. E602]